MPWNACCKSRLGALGHDESNEILSIRVCNLTEAWWSKWYFYWPVKNCRYLQNCSKKNRSLKNLMSAYLGLLSLSLGYRIYLQFLTM